MDNLFGDRTILILDDDPGMIDMYNARDLTQKFGADVDIRDSTSDIEDWSYDVTVAEYSVDTIEEVYENADNLILYTRFDRDEIEVPAGTEILQKGRPLDVFERAVKAYLH